jgi:hypothetical protein
MAKTVSSQQPREFEPPRNDDYRAHAAQPSGWGNPAVVVSREKAAKFTHPTRRCGPSDVKGVPSHFRYHEITPSI